MISSANTCANIIPISLYQNDSVYQTLGVGDHRMNRKLPDLYPQIEDVSSEYKDSRRKGLSRDEAIAKALSDFNEQCVDHDDQAQIWIGLAKAAAEKKELTEDLLEKAIQSYDDLVRFFPESAADINKEKERICNPSSLGAEKQYPKKSIYKPDWKTGDTFIMPMDTEYSRNLGMKDWFAIIRKINEFQNHRDQWVEMVYCTICEPGKLPRNVDELNALGFIPIRYISSRNSFEFQAGIRIYSKNTINKYGFTYIGNYVDAISPNNYILPSKYTYFQLFPKKEATEKLPEHPGTIVMTLCDHYLKYGRLF